MDETNNALRDAIVNEVILRLYEESLPRINRCLDQLTQEQIWWRPNPSSNSIGNLVLHLSGNVRQWICAGLGGNEDHRHRQLEFDTQEGYSGEVLKNQLMTTMSEARPFIEQVAVTELLRKRSVQTFEETGLTILVHVTEHFSYHTGQIAYITKTLKDRQLGFYEDIRLE